MSRRTKQWAKALMQTRPITQKTEGGKTWSERSGSANAEAIIPLKAVNKDGKIGTVQMSNEKAGRIRNLAKSLSSKR